MRDALAQALAERPEGEDALETVRKFILTLHENKGDDLDEKMRLCIESDETLRSHLRARLASLEELIAPAIAKDLDAADDDLRPGRRGFAHRGLQRLDRARRRPPGKAEDRRGRRGADRPDNHVPAGRARRAQDAPHLPPTLRRQALHTFPPSVAEERLFQRGTTLVRRLRPPPARPCTGTATRFIG